MIKQCNSEEIAVHHPPTIVPVSVFGRHPPHIGAYNTNGVAGSSDSCATSSEDDEGPDDGDEDYDNEDSADEHHPLLLESRGGGGGGGEVGLAAGGAAANTPGGVGLPEDTDQAKVRSSAYIF